MLAHLITAVKICLIICVLQLSLIVLLNNEFFVDRSCESLLATPFNSTLITSDDTITHVAADRTIDRMYAEIPSVTITPSTLTIATDPYDVNDPTPLEKRPSHIKMRKVMESRAVVVWQGPEISRPIDNADSILHLLDWVVIEFFIKTFKLSRGDQKLRIYLAGRGQVKPVDPAGGGYGGGDEIVVYSTISFNFAAVVHEMGHCFGIGGKEYKNSGFSIGEAFTEFVTYAAFKEYSEVPGARYGRKFNTFPVSRSPY